MVVFDREDVFSSVRLENDAALLGITAADDEMNNAVPPSVPMMSSIRSTRPCAVSAPREALAEA